MASPGRHRSRSRERHAASATGAARELGVAVVGAGLAGLSLARGLCRSAAPVRVAVFEQSHHLDPGALRNLPVVDQGIKALESLGFGSAARLREGEVNWTSRNELLKELSEALPAGSLHFCRSLAGIREASDGTDGLFCDFLDTTDAETPREVSEGPFDLVVGADGLRSQVRALYAAAAGHTSSGRSDLLDGGVLLLGDARRVFGRERDLGFGRIRSGGNCALAEGFELASLLTGAVELSRWRLHSGGSRGEAVQALRKAVRDGPAADYTAQMAACWTARLTKYCRRRHR